MQNKPVLEKPVTVRRAFNPDLLYQEELFKSRSGRVKLFVMLILLGVAMAVEIVMFAVGAFDLTYIMLPIITGLAALLAAFFLFWFPKRSAASYKKFFASMEANDDIFTFHADRMVFEEGAPILPDNVPNPPLVSGLEDIPYATVRRITADSERVTLEFRQASGKYAFIIPRSADVTEDEWKTLLDYLNSLKEQK